MNHRLMETRDKMKWMKQLRKRVPPRCTQLDETRVKEEEGNGNLHQERFAKEWEEEKKARKRSVATMDVQQLL